MKFYVVGKRRLYLYFSLFVNLFSCYPFCFNYFTKKFIQVFEENAFFHNLFYQQLVCFCKIVRHKLPYFKLPFIISFLADFKLLICSEFNKYSCGGWAYIDLNTLNLSHKCTVRLSCLKIQTFFPECWCEVEVLFNKKCPNGRDPVPSWK